MRLDPSRQRDAADRDTLIVIGPLTTIKRAQLFFFIRDHLPHDRSGPFVKGDLEKRAVVVEFAPQRRFLVGHSHRSAKGRELASPLFEGQASSLSRRRPKGSKPAMPGKLPTTGFVRNRTQHASLGDFWCGIGQMLWPGVGPGVDRLRSGPQMRSSKRIDPIRRAADCPWRRTVRRRLTT